MSGGSSRRYPPELRERAVRMVAEISDQHESEWAAISEVARLLGVGCAETVRKWVRQAQIDGCVRPGITTEESAELKRLRRENFDVVMVGDHFGDSAPFPILVAIADAVPSVRVSTLVINRPLYRPALLARDLATVDAASGGRLEIGLGSGYIEGDFAVAGVPFSSAGQRVELLNPLRRPAFSAPRRVRPPPGYSPVDPCRPAS